MVTRTQARATQKANLAASKAKVAAAKKVPTQSTQRKTVANPTGSNAAKFVPASGRPSSRTPETLLNVPGSTPLPQQKREDARLESIKRASGPEVITDVTALSDMRSRQYGLLAEGKITQAEMMSQAQFDAAKASLDKGAKGVDPMGFNRGEVLPQVGGVKGTETVRDEPGAALGGGAGAGGQVGELGYNPSNSFFRPGAIPAQGLEKAMAGATGMTTATTKSGKTVQVHDPYLEAQQKASIQQQYDSELARAKESAAQQKNAREMAGAATGGLGGVTDPKSQQRESDMTVPGATTIEVGTAGAGSYLSTVDTSGASAGIQNLMGIAEQNPDLAPFILSQVATMQAQLGGIEAYKNAALSEIGTGAELGAILERQEGYLKEEKDEADSLRQEGVDIQMDVLDTQKQVAEIQKNKFEIEQQRREQEARETLVQQELQNRRTAAKLGIGFDTGGLEWMQRELSNGKKNLALMEEMGDLESSRLALEISQNYTNNMNAIWHDFKTATATANKTFNEDLAALTKTLYTDPMKDIREARAEVREKAFEKQYDLEFKAAERMFDLGKDFALETHKSKLREIEERAKEKVKAAEDAMKPLYDAKDIQDYRIQYRKDIAELPGMKEYGLIAQRYVKMKVAMESEGESQTVRDEALIVLYEKILDTPSVVRSEEFDRIIKGQGFTRKLLNKAVREARSLLNQDSGQPISDKIRQSMTAMAGKFMEASIQTVMDEIAPSLASIDAINRDSPDNKILWEEVLDPNIIRALPEPIDEYLQMQGIMDGTSDIRVPNIGDPNDFLRALAEVHATHEGFGTPQAATITTQNNPGALKWNPDRHGQFGGVMGAKGFAAFPNAESGYAALIDDLYAKINGGSGHVDYASNPTILDYVSAYAPSSDGNDPSSYAQFIVREMSKRGFDISIDTPLSVLSAMLT